MENSLKTASLLTLWVNTSIRHWKRHWLQFVILVAILALGVASFLSIRMANRAAIQGFRGFTDSVTGTSDFTLNAQGDRFLLEWLPEIREALKNEPIEIAPILQIPARIQLSNEPLIDDPPIQRSPGQSLSILGVDIIGIRNINNTVGAGILNTLNNDEEVDLFSVMGESRSIFLSPRLTRILGKKVGDSLSVLINDYQETLTIRGTLPTSRLGVEVPEDLAVMDLPAAMELIKDSSAITRVELVLESDKKSAEVMQGIQDTLRNKARGRWNVMTPQSQAEANASMTAAFRLNLTILSLISLLVGLYLITQSMDSAVIQRRKEIGILRALGVLPVEIRKLWILDLAVFGVLGSLSGILVGWLAAQSVVVVIARTVNALYLSTTAQSAQLNGMDWIIGLGLGMAGSLIAGIFPLNVANNIAPARILASGRQEIKGSRFPYQWLGWSLLALGFVFSQIPPVRFASDNSLPVFGYGASFLWLFGGALTLAGMIAPIGRMLKKLCTGFLAGNVGFGKLRTPGNRHRLAVSGLFIAIGMAASMSILIGSFETTMVSWLKTRFQADIYVSSRAFGGGSSLNYVRESTFDQIAGMEGIQDVSSLRYLNISYRKKPVFLMGFRSELMGNRETFLWIEPLLAVEDMPPEADAWVVSNEAFQYKFAHKLNEVISVDSPAGEKKLWIRGVKADYGSDRGSLLVDQVHLKSWYGVKHYSNLSLYLDREYDPSLVAQRLRDRFPELAIREQAALLLNAIRVFKETFAVTYGLRILGLFVAVVGLALALLNILKEDASSLATLNALGVSRRERAGITACEGLGMTLVAILGGLGLSLALGWLLVFVINRQSFGWTLQYQVPWNEILNLAALLIILGGLVSWLVGWLHGNQKPLQEE